MKKFRKILLALIIATLAIASVFAMVGCGGSDDDTDKVIKVEFMSKGEIYRSVAIESFEMPSNPSYLQGFVFIGWFLEEEYQNEFTAAYMEGKKFENNFKVYARWDASTYSYK